MLIMAEPETVSSVTSGRSAAPMPSRRNSTELRRLRLGAVERRHSCLRACTQLASGHGRGLKPDEFDERAWSHLHHNDKTMTGGVSRDYRLDDRDEGRRRVRRGQWPQPLLRDPRGGATH